MIKRDAEDQLLALLQRAKEPKNVILVEGARQVGKTYLIERVLKNLPHSVRINLETDKILREKIDQTDSFANFTRLLELETGFVPSEKALLFIDEAQESDKLGGYVRSMKEVWRNASCILSGSSMTRLFREDTRVPVGRVTRLEVTPCSFIEFLRSRKKEPLVELIRSFPSSERIDDNFHQELLNEADLYLNVGGLPEVVLAFNRGENFAAVRRAILLDQEEDFIRKTAGMSRFLFQDGMRAVASFLGSSSKLSHVQVALNEAKHIFSLLQLWHLVVEIDQRGLSSTTSFNPKRYLYDLGIAHEVRKSPFPRLSILNTLNSALRTDLGGLLENLVLLQLTSEGQGSSHITSWKKNNKEPVEVDFVMHDKDPIPIECKSSHKITPRSFQYVRTFLEQSGGKIGFICSPTQYIVLNERGKKLINLPIYLCRPEIVRELVR